MKNLTSYKFKNQVMAAQGWKTVVLKKKLLEEGNWESPGSVNLIRDEMSEKDRMVGKVVFSESRSFGPR